MEIGVTIKRKETSSQLEMDVIHLPLLAYGQMHLYTNKIFSSISTRFNPLTLHSIIHYV